MSAECIAAVLGDAGARAIAFVLGSGQGALFSDLPERRALRYADIPGFPGATTAGHTAEVCSGLLHDKPVLVFAGRTHWYEGADATQLAHTVRTIRHLGVQRIVFTNAAGGIGAAFVPGALMLVADHIGLFTRSPLPGNRAHGEQLFTDMSAPYDAALNNALLVASSVCGVSLTPGVYGAVQGPSYETRSEIAMLARLGADAVGMSTVPEVLAARAGGLRCAAISCITNRATGLSQGKLSHDDVLLHAGAMQSSLQRLLSEFVRSAEN